MEWNRGGIVHLQRVSELGGARAMGADSGVQELVIDAKVNRAMQTVLMLGCCCFMCCHGRC